MNGAPVVSGLAEFPIGGVRPPPHFLEGEQSVLGGLLLDNAAWDKIAGVISERHFYRADHRCIYRHIAELIEHNQPADVITVAESLEGVDELAGVGGLSYLSELASNTPAVANIRSYAEIVRKQADRRELLAHLEDLSDKVHTADAQDIRMELLALADASVSESRSRILTGGDFVAAYTPSKWLIDRILQRGYVYALTGLWGHGKTALALTLALHIAMGRPIHELAVARSRVLYLCGENPDDVRARLIALMQVLDVAPDLALAQMDFTDRPFKIDDARERREFLLEAARAGPYGLVVVDTGPAHSDRDEENSNTQAHELAMGVRECVEPLGGPALLVNMHPVKNATRDNLQPRGGGAFSGSIDGELCCWLATDSRQIEFFHRSKLRGPGFSSLFFDLQKCELPLHKDNFGRAAETIIALPGEQRTTRASRPEPTTEDARIALMALREEMAASGERLTGTSELPQGVRGVRVDDLRKRFYNMLGEQRSDLKKDSLRQALGRGLKKLVATETVRMHSGFVWFCDRDNERDTGVTQRDNASREANSSVT